MNEGLLCSLCVYAFSFCLYNWKTEALFINIWIKLKVNDGKQFPITEIWVETRYAINISRKAWISIKIPWHRTVTTYGNEVGARRSGRQHSYSGTETILKWFLFNSFRISTTLGISYITMWMWKQGWVERVSTIFIFCFALYTSEWMHWTRNEDSSLSASLGGHLGRRSQETLVSII